MYNKKYEALEWSNERATKILDRVLPKRLGWDQEDNYYYYDMGWAVWRNRELAKITDKIWMDKFAYKLHRFILEGYENPNYTKEIKRDWCDDHPTVIFKEKTN